MVSIKFFKDGNRQVIVLEGADDINVENMLKEITQKAINGEYSIKQETPSTAEAIPAESNPDISIPVNFEDGPYKGMSPFDVIKTEDVEELNAAIAYLIEQKEDINNILYTDIEKALCTCMCNKLASADPEEYAAKLTPAQLTKFYGYFEKYMPRSVIDNLLNQFKVKSIKELIDSTSEDVLRKSVTNTILLCRNY